MGRAEIIERIRARAEAVKALGATALTATIGPFFRSLRASTVFKANCARKSFRNSSLLAFALLLETSRSVLLSDELLHCEILHFVRAPEKSSIGNSLWVDERHW
jgi:hypothetical protein